MDDKQVETTVYSLAEAAPGPSERRGDERYLTLFRVGSLMIGDRRELCLIKNISAGGMLIRVYCAIAPETRVRVELKHGTPVDGVVRWTQDKTVGITFDTPIDVVELLSASMDGPRPRMPRVEVDCQASLREDATVHRVQVCDVSQGGLKVETASSVTVGSEVVVTLPGLAPQPGVVRWSHSGCYGITFNRVLPLPMLVAWLQEQRERLRATG